MTMDRRALLKLAGLTPLVAAMPRLALAESQAPDAKADYILHIGTGLVELSPTHIVSTTLYNDQFPGPLLRFKEGQQVIVDVHNDTDTPELVHWHGQLVPSDVDGASEEGTPFVPAHGMRRIVFVPRPRAFASITRTSSRVRISTGAPTQARRAPSTSNRRATKGRTIVKSF
jgi:hypothetical protein